MSGTAPLYHVAGLQETRQRNGDLFTRSANV